MKSHAQCQAWHRLSKHTRSLLLSHRPDELERHQNLRRETREDLERHFGPMQWDATVAIVAEGEKTGADDSPGGTDEDDGCMSLDQIGEHFGITKGMAHLIVKRALRKLVMHPTTFDILRELHTGEPVHRQRAVEQADAALHRADWFIPEHRRLDRQG